MPAVPMAPNTSTCRHPVLPQVQAMKIPGEITTFERNIPDDIFSVYNNIFGVLRDSRNVLAFVDLLLHYHRNLA